MRLITHVRARLHLAWWSPEAVLLWYPIRTAANAIDTEGGEKTSGEVGIIAANAASAEPVAPGGRRVLVGAAPAVGELRMIERAAVPSRALASQVRVAGKANISTSSAITVADARPALLVIRAGIIKPS